MYPNTNGRLEKYILLYENKLQITAIFLNFYLQWA